jgi:hypothetical protein
MMLEYFLYIKNEENEELVTQILRPIVEGDQITEDVARGNLAKLELLKSIGETEIFDAVMEDLREDESYSKYMSRDKGS